MGAASQPDMDERESSPDARAAAVVRYLARIVGDPLPPSAPPSRLEGIEGLEDLALTLAAMRSFADRLAAGDLSGELPARGYFPGTLKMLQANLRHLAWQTSRIAAGDLTQHVDFMGDFSQAFNAMVERLKDSLAALRLSERKYRKLAITDNLTGLYNPRYFFTIAGREFRRALRHRRPLAVIMLDVDDFKAINDRHGHAVGDMALREIAQVLGNPLRGTDLLARYGGEEFIVLLPDTGCQAAVAVAEKLRENVEGCLIGGRLKITASFGTCGIETFAGERLSAAGIMEVMVKRADQALYRSKNAGKNQVTFLALDDDSANGLGFVASRTMHNSKT